MKITDFLRHDAQAYGVPEAPSIERILEVCVEAANWIDNLENRLAQAERERDALMHDFLAGKGCLTCKHGEKDYQEMPCFVCSEHRGSKFCSLKWEWRGVCKENSKEDKIDEGWT